MWTAARQRCRNPNSDGYHNYGARGIKFAAVWDDFARYVADIGPRPTPQHTLDRVDNDGDYAPGNVRWSLPVRQVRNSRVVQLTPALVRQIRSLYASGGYTQKELGSIYTVHKATIQAVLDGRTWRDII